jgi:hypothetical protein
MAGAEWVRWSFAAMFAALTMFYAVRLFAFSRDTSTWGGSADRSVDVFRGVMSLGMVAMLVPWVDPLPRPYWQLLFGVAAGHIAVRLIGRKVRPAPVARPGLGRYHELHLVIGGVAMVYMLAAMPAGHGRTEGMDMVGMTSTGFAPPLLTWAFVAYFLMFVVRLGARLAVPVNTLVATPPGAALLGEGPRGVVISPHLLGSSEVVMGIGMSYMLLTML